MFVSTRYALVCALLTSLGFLSAGRASAQPRPAEFPTKMVKIIVPFTAGGLTDVLVRGLAQELTQQWGQAVVVDNRPGANTIIGAELAAKSAPDGYTLLLANDPTLSANQYLYKKLPYDPVKDFVPVINLVATEGLLVVREGLPARTVAELIAEAKAKPGEITYGTFGPGSKAHLDTEELARLTGARFNHIPYKGVSEVMVALSSGQIDFTLSGVPPAIQLAQAGKIRPIALAAAQRTALFKDVPTFAEAGVANFESSSWFGLVAPRNTPPALVKRIAADISRIIRRPEFQQRYITGVGLTLLDLGPDAYARFLDKDRSEYAERIRNVNVKLD